MVCSVVKKLGHSFILKYGQFIFLNVTIFELKTTSSSKEKKASKYHGYVSLK